MKKIVRVLTSKTLIMLLQVAISALFIYYILNLNILPTRYIAVIAAVLAVLLLIPFIIMCSGRKKRREKHKTLLKRDIFSKLFSILISILLVVAIPYATRSNEFFSNITGKEGQKNVVSVIVLKNGDFGKASLKDLKGESFGVSYEKEKTNVGKTMNAIEDEIGKQDFVEYDTYAKLANELYDGKVSCIVVGEEYRVMLENEHDAFDEETRIVKSFEYNRKVVSTTKSTDVTEKPFTVYVTGLDTYGSVSTVSRSDVNMIVTVNPTTKQILMVSIPRDCQIELHKNGKMDKLTHTGIYGTDETINTIQDFLNVEINYYAKTNFQGITNIVDALGGVTVDSNYAFKTRHGDYDIVKGEQEMSGDKALCFVRERYNLPAGDFDRGRNQQALLKALLNKAMSPKIITNFERILTAVEGSFETDMSSSEIKSLINMQLDDDASWDVKNVQISGEGYLTSDTYSMSGTSIYVMKPYNTHVKSIIKLIDKVEAGDILTDKDVKGLTGE